MGLQTIGRKQMTCALGAVALVAAGAPAAHGALSMDFTINRLTVVIIDNSPFDTNPTTGVIDLNGSDLSAFFNGNLGAPVVQFNSVGATSNRASGTGSTPAALTQSGSVEVLPGAPPGMSIEIDAVETDFTSPAAPASMSESAADTYAFTSPGQTRTFQSFFDPTDIGNAVLPAPLEVFTPPTGAGPFGTSNPGQTIPIASTAIPFALLSETFITVPTPPA